MRKQDQLSALISSLSNNEKRYFKLQASLQSGDKTFKRLFDELAKGNVYEPQVLSKKLSITKPRLAHAKNYLEKVLLTSLKLFEQDNSPQMRLVHQWQVALMLFNRGQYKLAYSINEKAMAKAVDYEDFHTALKLVNIKYILLIYLKKSDVRYETEKQRSLIISQIAEDHQLAVLAMQFSKPTRGMKANKYLLQQIAQKALFKKEPGKLKSDTARIAWHEIKYHYHFFAMRDPQAGINHIEARLNIFEARPQLISTLPRQYLLTLLYLGGYHHQLLNLEKALKIAGRIEFETSGHRNDIPANLCDEFNLAAHMEMGYIYCHMKRYADAVKKFSEIESNMHQLNPANFVLAKYHQALALFYTGKYDEALKVSKSLYDFNPEVNSGLILCNRILLVMIHYALKNYSVLTHLAVSAANWARRYKIAYPGTIEITRWFQNFGKLAATGKEEAFFKNFALELETKLLVTYDAELDLKRWVAIHLKK